MSDGEWNSVIYFYQRSSIVGDELIELNDSQSRHCSIIAVFMLPWCTHAFSVNHGSAFRLRRASSGEAINLQRFLK